LFESNINNNNYDGINRGVELILGGGKKRQPNNFHIIFKKLLWFLKREVTIYFEFSLTIKKRKTIPIRRKQNVSS
jgi:hypothetical protein